MCSMLRDKYAKVGLICNMKKIMILAIALMLGIGNAGAQTTKVSESKKIVLNAGQSSSRSTNPPKETPYAWESGGIEYPIFISSSGSCFIYKVSKKTGKEYKQYLGVEVSTKISKEMGIEYKPKK